MKSKPKKARLTISIMLFFLTFSKAQADGTCQGWDSNAIQIFKAAGGQAIKKVVASKLGDQLAILQDDLITVIDSKGKILYETKEDGFYPKDVVFDGSNSSILLFSGLGKSKISQFKNGDKKTRDVKGKFFSFDVTRDTNQIVIIGKDENITMSAKVDFSASVESHRRKFVEFKNAHMAKVPLSKKDGHMEFDEAPLNPSSIMRFRGTRISIEKEINVNINGRRVSQYIQKDGSVSADLGKVALTKEKDDGLEIVSATIYLKNLVDDIECDLDLPAGVVPACPVFSNDDSKIYWFDRKNDAVYASVRRSNP
jgi:hypothetical protein